MLKTICDVCKKNEAYYSFKDLKTEKVVKVEFLKRRTYQVLAEERQLDICKSCHKELFGNEGHY